MKPKGPSGLMQQLSSCIVQRTCFLPLLCSLCHDIRQRCACLLLPLCDALQLLADTHVLVRYQGRCRQWTRATQREDTARSSRLSIRSDPRHRVPLSGSQTNCPRIPASMRLQGSNMCHHFGWRLGGNVRFDSLGLSNTQRDFILHQPFLYIFRILYALLLHHTFCFPLCLFDQSPSRQLCFTFRFSTVLDWPVQYLSSASLPPLRNFRAVQISYII